ncbi:hypothetical protein CWO90_05730 [Bradyrhizobium sp. Leo121]|nr:hypothetical protein CWO90_05730 [Bradyrhizobium sp. Leo121]
MKHETVLQTSAATSGLVRRLVRAQGDPAKQRIRAWLGNICDEKLLNFGLSAADIALLRARYPENPDASGRKLEARRIA